MNKCDCWYKEEKIVGWCGFSPLTKTVYECYGTKEREVCHCMGDRGKCDFYQEVREKAMKVPATIDEAIFHFTMGITHDIFNEPLTIEQLKQMDGEPVWCADGEGHSCYCLVNAESEDCIDSECGAWCFEFYGMTGDGENGLHNMGWLAYDHKPGGEQT